MIKGRAKTPAMTRDRKKREEKEKGQCPYLPEGGKRIGKEGGQRSARGTRSLSIRGSLNAKSSISKGEGGGRGGKSLALRGRGGIERGNLQNESLEARNCQTTWERAML